MSTVTSQGLFAGADGRSRCWWCSKDDTYQLYHDREWGRPVLDEQRLFEKICLESFQSGLSWLTILRKRENFRKSFYDFDINKVAEFKDQDRARLVLDKGIVRHAGKINSVIHNAKQAQILIQEVGSLATYFWSFKPAVQALTVAYQTAIKTPFTTESIALSKDLKKRGWKFVGPTTCYAFMQAMGMVNDHITGCYVREEIETAVS